jgi:hypothetical protein
MSRKTRSGARAGSAPGAEPERAPLLAGARRLRGAAALPAIAGAGTGSPPANAQSQRRLAAAATAR